MKNTRLFSALLCGAVLFAGCSFNGTENTFEKDIKAKYENDENVKTSHSVLFFDSFYTSWVADNSDPDEVTEWTYTITTYTSLASTDGITISKLSGTDDKEPYSFNSYPGSSVILDPEDPTQKTVKIKVSGKDQPKDWFIKADAAKVKAVTGAMLDNDYDGYWGEPEDSYCTYLTADAKGYYNESYFTKSAPNWTVSADSEPGTYIISTQDASVHPDDEKTFNSMYWVEVYDAGTDTWSKMTTAEPKLLGDDTYKTYQIKYSLSSYKPVRFCCGDLNKLEQTYVLPDDSKVKRKTTTKNFLPSAASKNVIDLSSAIPSVWTGYLDPTKTNWDLELTSVGNGVFKVSRPSAGSIIYTDITDSSNKIVTTSFEGWKAESGCIKVLRKTNKDSKYFEINTVVSVSSDKKDLFLKLVDKESTADDFIVIANKGLSANFTATVDGTPDETVNLTFGSLALSDNSILKGGWQYLTEIKPVAEIEINNSLVDIEFEALIKEYKDGKYIYVPNDEGTTLNFNIPKGMSINITVYDSDSGTSNTFDAKFTLKYSSNGSTTTIWNNLDTYGTKTIIANEKTEVTLTAVPYSLGVGRNGNVWVQIVLN